MKLSLVFIGLLILVLGGLVFTARQLGYFEKAGPQKIFEVQKGENFSLIAAKLQRAGVIKSERAFRWYVNFNMPSKPLKRGEFELYENMPIPAVIKAITEGKPIEYKVTIPEGQNIFQVAQILESKGFVKSADFLTAARLPEVLELIPTVSAGAPKPNSIEGYIYPDTYMLQKIFTPKEIAQVMVLRFRDEYQKLSQEIKNSDTVKSLSLTPHQVITLASIVEKETGAAAERPIIASIFVNRLRKPMRLQTDPTVIYGVWLKKGSWDGNIHRSDLDTFNEYNTYQINGLPPGPIASPGVNAIRAVLNPAQTDYFYFVSNNDGTHFFSHDFKDHQKAVRDLQVKPGAKGGKSWRDLPASARVKN